MCGIAGSYPEKNNGFIADSIKKLSHRGPDAYQVVDTPYGTFGHSRLAIVDVDGGHQPMKKHGNLITFNGQIYNFQQLREDLPGSFSTKSDTEVILQVYDRYGPNCAALLDGMFAIAIMDGDDLFLARDPLGIKPLYYAVDQNRLFFASEIKALTRQSGNIREFPAGHWWHSKYGFRQYYRLSRKKFFKKHKQTRPDFTHLSTIQEALRRAVHKRLIADNNVPVGVSLSGGLDSSIVASLAKEFKSRLDTFVVGTPDSKDIPAAAFMSKYLGTRHHVYQYSYADLLSALPEVIYHLESFDAALVRSAIPNYFLAKLASDHVKVILTGEGADELFAGYEYLSAVTDGQELDQEIKQLTSMLHNTNLQRADRMAMAHGLEGRVPFLDENVVDLSLNLPANWKLHKADWPEKALLRKSFENMLPAKIAKRPKAKFSRGAGSMDMLAEHANERISDSDFSRERNIGPKIALRSKEELLYYRIFKNTFGNRIPLDTIGRTRSITRTEVI